MRVHIPDGAINPFKGVETHPFWHIEAVGTDQSIRAT